VLGIAITQLFHRGRRTKRRHTELIALTTIRTRRRTSRRKRSLVGFRTRLGARTTRNIRLLATHPPPPTRDRAVIETDEVAQLVELQLRQLARIADTQMVERQVRKGDTLELVDVVANRLDHPVNLAMLALVDRDAEPRVLRLARKNLDLGGHRHRPVVELNAVAQDLDVLGRELPVNLHVIRLRHVARRCE